jgi:hypothetical protein
MAYKKAGGEMAAFKKFLTKAENGIEVNSQGNPVKSDHYQRMTWLF